jgi:cyclopropane-fatty-acyl-phospholipid synthase
MTVLDVGCGWGATMTRAVEKYDVNVIGLTLSINQAAHVRKMLDQMDTPLSRRVVLAGWEQFDEPVDRIVCIGAFEHFGHERYSRFFTMAYQALPPDGVMLLQTIVRPAFKELRRRGLTLTRELVHFCEFILAEIFPGGGLSTVSVVEEHAAKVGFAVTRVQSLQAHYARTLDTWAAALHSNKRQAIAIQSQEVYERYMAYLTGCSKLFHDGYTDVTQFTLQRSPLS